MLGNLNTLIILSRPEPTEVLVKLTHSPDEAFSRKMGDSSSNAVRETIMRAFAEEKIKEALTARDTRRQRGCW